MAQHRYLLKGTTDEFDAWRGAADSCGMSLAAWIRAALNGTVGLKREAPRGRPVATPVAGGRTYGSSS